MTQEMQKYLFDRNNFDIGAIDPNNPPAPTFSEDELAAAKTSAFAEGHKKGLQDGQASRDQQVVGLITCLIEHIKELMAHEADRNAKFQDETVRLALALYQKTFPLLNDHFGLDQITATLTDTIQSMNAQTAIQVEVAAQDLNDLSDRLKPFLSSYDGQVTLLSGTDIAPGSFRVKWQNGGAVRDTNALSSELMKSLERILERMPEQPNTP